MQISGNSSLEISKNILNDFGAKILSKESLEDSFLLLYNAPTERFAKLNKYTAGSIIGLDEKDSVAVDNKNLAYVYFFRNSFDANLVNTQFDIYKYFIDNNINNFFTMLKKEVKEYSSINHQEEIFCFADTAAFKKNHTTVTPFNTQNLIGHGILLEGSYIGNSILGNDSYQYIVGITYNMQYIANITNLKILISCIVELLERSFQRELIEEKDFIEMYNLYMHKFIS